MHPDSTPRPLRANQADLTGQRFGRLIVERIDRSQPRHMRWVCRCDCGGIRIARAGALRSGATSSCGCLWKEKTTKHGMSGSSEFTIWGNMIGRCHNPKNKDYPKYGGRGIIVCDRWRADFMAFYEDMGPRPSRNHSVERRDNDGGYSPENCRWATPAEQAKNRRSSRPIEFRGEVRLLVDWARHLGMKVVTLESRLRKGWSIEQALTVPVQTRNSKPFP